MANRTAYWALFVCMSMAYEIETWVATLLHDVGLEYPPTKGDFIVGGSRC